MNSVSPMKKKGNFMSINQASRVLSALSIAVAIFLVAIVLPRMIFESGPARLATTQGLELILSLVAIAVLGKGKFSEYGFCLPKGGYQWMLIAATAPLLGIAATIAVLGLGGSGSPVAKSLTFPQIVLFVWILSSTIEEVFTRGFLQGHLAPLSGRYLEFPLFKIEIPVLVSAVFFSAMHLVLAFSGADAVTTVVTLLFTFAIGLIAGHLRSLTGSLIPAIVVHMLANIGGMIGGILYAVFCMLTGRPLPGV
ncbi:MAG: CPBP family intramembrane glutamic endopeptidase [Candidatus Zixiibacteriota bacterium]